MATLYLQVRPPYKFGPPDHDPLAQDSNMSRNRGPNSWITCLFIFCSSLHQCSQENLIWLASCFFFCQFGYPLLISAGTCSCSLSSRLGSFGSRLADGAARADKVLLLSSSCERPTAGGDAKLNLRGNFSLPSSYSVLVFDFEDSVDPYSMCEVCSFLNVNGEFSN